VPRSIDDSWDITTRVGFTALAVCAARALDAALNPPLANDEYAARFVSAAGEASLAAAVANTDMTCAAAYNARWVGVRTRFFDDFFTLAAASGIQQMVIMAAGLDCRAYRLAWPADSTMFEVDQPRVLDFKQKVLDGQGAVPSTRRVTVAVDLRGDWAASLRGSGFDPKKPTVWSLEGLLPYLPGAAQDELFERLHELSAHGSRLAAELGSDPGEREQIAECLSGIAVDSTQVNFGDLWYDDSRRDTKVWLAERDWAVTAVDLVDKAVEYGRAFHALPSAFDHLLRTKLFTAILME
jgi:methyltransferase (TIGR00027 family)